MSDSRGWIALVCWIRFCTRKAVAAAAISNPVVRGLSPLTHLIVFPCQPPLILCCIPHNLVNQGMQPWSLKCVLYFRHEAIMLRALHSQHTRALEHIPCQIELESILQASRGEKIFNWQLVHCKSGHHHDACRFMLTSQQTLIHCPDH